MNFTLHRPSFLDPNSININFQNLSIFQHAKKLSNPSKPSHNHDSKSSLDSCNTTVDDSLSPKLKDFHCSFNSSLDGIDESDNRSLSSNENQEENRYTMLNCALNQRKKIVPDDTKFKTELCKKFSETGQCPYGKKCKFAHGKNELNERKVLNSGRYKSKKCASFHNNMMCSYGVRCLFAHEERSLEEISGSSHYAKYAFCPDLLSFPATEKKKRLPVFQEASNNGTNYFRNNYF